MNVKLSEAIRLGAMLKPQAFGDYWADGGSCAIGAACDAAGVMLADIHYFESGFEALFRQACPACGVTPDDKHTCHAGFCNTVVHLNDTHRWTREQIADWVATIEAQQESPAVEQPALMKVGA